MHIIAKKKFRKQFNKLPVHIQKKTHTALTLFKSNPFHSTLRNHALKGARIGYRSIDVTGDMRVIFQELSDNTYEFVCLIDIGTHSQLY